MGLQNKTRLDRLKIVKTKYQSEKSQCDNHEAGISMPVIHYNLSFLSLKIGRQQKALILKEKQRMNIMNMNESMMNVYHHQM